MRKKLLLVIIAMVSMVLFSLPVSAKKSVGFGNLFYDDEIVRTVIPPAAMPFLGRDNLYAIEGGVEGQLAVAAVAPGDRDYHGGKWALHVVKWEATPYLLTSEADVLAAAEDGDVTIERMAGNDFKCPIQP
jgi:hypothetical protein